MVFDYADMFFSLQGARSALIGALCLYLEHWRLKYPTVVPRRIELTWE